MNTNQITCPNCGHHFEATSALTSQIKSHLESEYTQKIKAQETSLKAELNQKWLEMEKQRQVELGQQKQKMEIDAKNKVELELKDLQARDLENQKRLEEAGKRELEMRQQARELEEQKKNMELEIARKMDEERKAIEQKITSEMDEKTRLSLAEKDKQMEQLKKSLEDANRRAGQGSQQIQGDVQENDLKEILSRNFGSDQVRDVATGVRGADIVHTVHNNFGQKLGVILWESKRTKSWTEDWVKKLKDDQASIQADVSVVATQTLPEGIDSYGYYNGVWVVKYNTSYILALTSTIRHFLGEMHTVKNSQVGKGEKMEYLYSYLASPQFRNKIENIVDAFSSMQEGIDVEKRAMQRIWSKREKELDRVIASTTTMYGDLQGIMGAKLERVERLELETGGDEEGDEELF
jgi:hypothetical protein